MARHRTIGPSARSSSVNSTGLARTAGSAISRPWGSPRRARSFEMPRMTPWMASHRIRCRTGPCMSGSIQPNCSSVNYRQRTELLFGMARKRIPAEERRIRILDAAVEVFADRGYAGAKMSDIAAHAGVVPSVLYDHFASKRELHVTLLEQHAQQLRERSLRRLEGASVEELVRAGIANYFEFVEKDPFIWRVLHQDPPADADIAAVYRDIADQGTASIADLIKFGAGKAKSVNGITLDDAAWILARA